MTIYSLDVFLSQFLTNLLFHGHSNCCFLICIQISQEANKVIWYSHLLKNFPQFVVVHIVKGFSVVNETEVDVFLEFSCFFYDPVLYGMFSLIIYFIPSSIYMSIPVSQFIPLLPLPPRYPYICSMSGSYVVFIFLETFIIIFFSCQLFGTMFISLPHQTLILWGQGP